MDPNIIDYYIINCAIPSIITFENRYQIDFGKPAHDDYYISLPNRFWQPLRVDSNLNRDQPRRI